MSKCIQWVLDRVKTLTEQKRGLGALILVWFLMGSLCFCFRKFLLKRRSQSQPQAPKDLHEKTEKWMRENGAVQKAGHNSEFT